MKKHYGKLLIIVLLLVLLNGCNSKERTEVHKGVCIQQCVIKMLDIMASSDHNIFSASAIKESQRICEKNLIGTKCVKDCLSDSYSYK